MTPQIVALEPAALVRLQIGLEYQLGDDGLIDPFPGSTENAWFIVYRWQGGHASYFRRDLPASLRSGLARMGPDAPFEDPERVKRALAAHAPCDSIFAGETATFAAQPDPAIYPDAVILDAKRLDLVEGSGLRLSPAALSGLRGSGADRPPSRIVAAVIVAGALVAVCESVRENASAAEAWVQTLPSHRRRGYGSQAVACWAGAVMGAGKAPFYSFASHNQASRALAERLGLTRVAAVAAYD